MKINFKQFKEKSFLIPLTAYGNWGDYKQFSGTEWHKNILNVLRLVITASNPTISTEEVLHNAEQQLDILVQTIKENLAPQRPCLALAFPPAQCWFVAFVVDAFLPLENVSNNNIFSNKYYAETEQTVEIVKVKGDPVKFAFQLIEEIK